MNPRFLLILPAFALAVACSANDAAPATTLAPDAGPGDAATDTVADSNPAPDAQPDDAAADTEVDSNGVSFQADVEPAGASLMLAVDVSEPETPVVQVRAKQLGSVFGVAFHVAFDASVLTAADPEPTAFLGPDAPNEARYLIHARHGDVSVGGARRGPVAGEVNLDDTALIASIPVSVIGAGTSKISILRAQVRRADGSVLPVSLAGGVFSVGGAQ